MNQSFAVNNADENGSYSNFIVIYTIDNVTGLIIIVLVRAFLERDFKLYYCMLLFSVLCVNISIND